MKARVEFRQVNDKMRSNGWAMLIQFHVDDILAFLEWTGHVGEMDMRRVKTLLNKKTKRTPKPIDIYPKHSGKWRVYPREGYVEKFEVGLHYVCQHGFDILPHDVKAGMYNHYYRDEPKVVGTLYPIPSMNVIFPDMKESYPVTDVDVAKGFHLDSKEVKEYSNSFTIWIIKQAEASIKSDSLRLKEVN
jgi:hypothetical protein